jgi:hypothetical protein
MSAPRNENLCRGCAQLFGNFLHDGIFGEHGLAKNYFKRISILGFMIRM